MNERAIGFLLGLILLIGLGVIQSRPSPVPLTEDPLERLQGARGALGETGSYTAVASHNGLIESKTPDATALEARSLAEKHAMDQPLSESWWGSTDPRALLESMSDEELISALTSLTPYSEEELGEVRNLREFGLKLAQIALGESRKPEEPEPVVPVVEFSAEENIAADNSTMAPQLQFSPEAGPIFAVFPSDHYGGERVVVTWRQQGKRQPILFNRYPINRTERFNYVWFEPPEDWSPGAYEVSIHGDRRTLPVLAQGTYEVQ